MTLKAVSVKSGMESGRVECWMKWTGEKGMVKRVPPTLPNRERRSFFIRDRTGNTRRLCTKTAKSGYRSELDQCQRIRLTLKLTPTGSPLSSLPSDPKSNTPFPDSPFQPKHVTHESSGSIINLLFHFIIKYY